MRYRKINAPQKAATPKIPGWFNFAEIYDHVVDRFPNGSTFVEVGSWLGCSAAYMATRIKEENKQIHFFCVDTWRGSLGTDTTSDNIHAATLAEYNGDVFPCFRKNLQELNLYHLVTPYQMKSVEGATKFEPKQVDFVYIDAAHDYKSVLEDLVAWTPKIKRHGIIAGHDFEWPGVGKAVREFFPKFKLFKTSWIVENPNQSKIKFQ